MAWDSEIVLLVRNYVGDTDVANQKYTDDSLSELILSAAQFVITDVPLPTDYLVDVENGSLSPDPTSRETSTSRDNSFINLTVLKSSWMIAYGEIRNYGSQAIAIRDGSSAVDLKRDLKALNMIMEGLKEDYLKFKDDYIRGSTTTGRLITSPIRIMSGGYCPSDNPYYGPLFRNYRW
jgi:hypothetical protein